MGEWQNEAPPTGRGFMDSRDFPVSAKMQLPDKNVRPIGFLKSLHSAAFS